MEPVLKYIGGKGAELPVIMKYVPREYDRYIEPFVGGGALFFHLEPRHAILGDLNGRLISFYRELRDGYPRLRTQLDALVREYDAKHDVKGSAEAEKLYYEMRRLYNEGRGPWTDGALFFFLNRTAYSGMTRCNADGDFNVPFGRYPKLRTETVTARHAKLLERAVLFEGDYTQLLTRAGQDDFVFLDPPYDHTFDNYGNAASGFTEQDHRQLAAYFKRLPCRALMVIGKTPLTQNLYAKHIMEEYNKSYSVNVRTRAGSRGTHLVVANYI